MYELSRVRLHSIGPKAARYQDVMLDLSGVGKSIPVALRLFDTDPAMRRPSPASVLFLENGGGKSVLIKLIFAVMLPGKRQTIGTTSTRVLEKFVLAEDVGLVALEWRHSVTGHLLVTGKVNAWRDHVVSSDPNRLAEAWFSFRPSDSFTLDALPVTHQDRLVSMAGFRDRFTAAGRTEPEVETVWETGHREWTDHLAALGLDPALFLYQLRMNAAEGAVADAFVLKTDEGFIDWLLTAVNDDDASRALGDLVSAFADKLAERESLKDEAAFVSGTMERLSPLAIAAGDAAEARKFKVEATQVARRFTAALSVRGRNETARSAALAEHLAVAKQAADTADRDQRRLNRISLELRRILAQIRVDNANKQLQSRDKQRTTAQVSLAGWLVTDRILQHRRAITEADTIRAVLQEKEAEAAPVLARRDRAAQRLARRLLALAAEADAERAALLTAVKAIATQVSDCRRQQSDANQWAGQHTGKISATEQLIAAIAQAVADAVRDGDIESLDDDVSAASLAADSSAGRSGDALRQTNTAISALRAQRKPANAALSNARKTLGDREKVTRSASSAVDDARTATSALESHPRLADLLGVSDVSLETDVAALSERLGAAIDADSARRTRLLIDTETSQRVLAALGAEGLLPPRDEITAAQMTLEAVGITSWTGWQYLAALPPDRRDSALIAHPELVDGVVLNQEIDLPRARQVLDEAMLLPRSLIAVGTTTTLNSVSAHTTERADQFHIGPNPALYDEDTAAIERAEITAAQVERAATKVDLDERIDTDGQLLSGLTEWRRRYPPGRIAELADTFKEALDQQERIARLVEEQVEKVAAADEEEDRLQALVLIQREEFDQLRDKAGRLRLLSERTTTLPELQGELQAARAALVLAQTIAEQAGAAADGLQGEKEELHRNADDKERSAGGYRREVGDVPGGGDVSLDLPVPAADVPSLRDAYNSADSAYQQIQVGVDLRAKVAAADEGVAATRAAVEQIDPAVRAAAEVHLTGPDGGDNASRAAATGRAQRDLAAAETAYTQQYGEVRRLESELGQLLPQEVSLEPYRRPDSIEDGEMLVAQTTSDWEAARILATDLATEAATLSDQHLELTGSLEGFRNLIASLAAYVSGDDTAEPEYDRSLADARNLQTTVLADVRAADELEAETSGKVRELADAVADFSTDPAFDRVQTPVRRQIIATKRDALPAHAADWESALRIRLLSITDDLRHIDEHRANIVTVLRDQVLKALSTLHQAQRLSKLPTNLGDWSGQEFLRIKYAEPDRTSLDGRLGEVIDKATSRRQTDTGNKNSGKIDGLNLLLRGVREAMQPGGVKVDMLKPDASLRTERTRVAEIGDVFSGGQLLTAAIILYCTMAALRSTDQGKSRRRHSGVLFLDNPIGRASAGYLLELQIGVAEALGVQLVYTTGLFDTNALSVFPLVIRLRNDNDVRAGRKYLSVERRIAATLDALPEPDGTGTVTSTRLFRRPAPLTVAGPNPTIDNNQPGQES